MKHFSFSFVFQMKYKSTAVTICLFLLAIMIAMPSSAIAQWVSLSKQNNQQKSPEVTLISSDKNSATIKIDLFGFNLNELVTQKGTFQSIDLLNDVYITETGETGKPALPYIAKVMAIPDNASVSYEIIEVGDVYTFKNIFLPPARECWAEGTPETEYLINEDAYNSPEMYPDEYVSLDPPSVFRDFRITRVSMFPIRYQPATKEIHVVSSLTIRLNYGKEEAINPKTAPKREIAPSFGTMYRSMIFNYQEVLDAEFGGKELGEEVLLYIMPDNFYPFFAEYVEWKELCGYKVILTKFSDISATATNPTTILNHVSDMYFFSQTPPTYVILVGDDGIFPKKIVTYPSYSFPDEDFFVKVDGNDFFPEMFVGRIPNQSNDKLQLMLKKFKMYEETPYMTDSTWFRKGICCSNNEFLSQIETKRFVAQMLLNEGDFLLVDTLMSNGIIGTSQGCTMNLTTVLNSINNGKGFLNYRGEGWSSGWWANCYPFNTSEVNNIQNGEKFTFVTSIGCGVAMFNAGGGNCFGEQWMKLGTVDNPRGAVNFVGPTSNSHTASNNRIDKGIYMGLFQEDMYTPGQALLRGKLFLYQELGTDPMVQYHFNVYCDLGDPSTRIWKTTPRRINADHPVSVEVFSNPFDIIVTHQTGGTPVKNANVNLRSDNVFMNAKTDDFGKATFDDPFTVVDTLDITITGPDIYPFYSTMYVVPSTSDINENHISKLKLLQNIPNPFTSNTEISFYLPKASNVKLNIYSLSGAHVCTLIDDYKAQGQHTISWNGKDQDGVPLSPGVYFYTLQTENQSASLRMMKLK